MYVPIFHAELSPVVHCNALLIYYPKYRDDMFRGKLVGKYISRLWRLSNSFRQKPTMIEKKFLQFQHILQYTIHRRGSKFQWKGTTPFSYLNFDYTDINIFIYRLKHSTSFIWLLLYFMVIKAAILHFEFVKWCQFLITNKISNDVYLYDGKRIQNIFKF